MIDIGIGIDIEKIKRFHNCLDDAKLLEKIFTKEEIKHFDSFEHPIPSIAARFCAKEAIIKAFGTCDKSIHFQDIEIFNNDNGVPYASQHKYKDHIIKMSVSHTEDTAIAIAFVVEK